MEIKQLEYFLVLSQELHFTRTAEKLNISQPSLLIIESERANKSMCKIILEK